MFVDLNIINSSRLLLTKLFAADIMGSNSLKSVLYTILSLNLGTFINRY